MKSNNLWERAKELNIQVSGNITGGFDIGFDEQIPEATKDALIRFVYWVEDHYDLPVTLWVDFKHSTTWWTTIRNVLDTNFTG